MVATCSAMTRAWLTTDTSAATDFICRRVRIPNDVNLIGAVTGALLQLTRDWNWEQFGTATPEETASMFNDMLTEYLESDACMIGAIFPYATSEPPPGCLVCDGTQYDRVDYPRLYDLLLPGLLVDTDHFVTPDLRGNFVWGRFDPNAPLVTGGEIEVTLTIDTMPAHDHADSGHLHAVHDHITTVALEPGEVPVSSPNPVPGATASASANITSTGGGMAHNNIPPFVLLNYAIVAR